MSKNKNSKRTVVVENNNNKNAAVETKNVAVNEFNEPITKSKTEVVETEKTGFDAIDKIAAVKKEKVEKAPKAPKAPTAPTAYGITIKHVCLAPNATIEEIKVVVEKEMAKEANMVSLRTIYTDVHRVIKLLRENGFMQK